MTQKKTSLAADRVTVMAAVDRASREHGVEIHHILGQSRVDAIARARHDAMMYARNAHVSYPRIASFMGRHHTTIIHGVEQARLRHSAQPVQNICKCCGKPLDQLANTR